MVDTDSQGTDAMLRDMAGAMIVSEVAEEVLEKVVKKGVDTVAVRLARSKVRKRVSSTVIKNVVKAVKSRVMKMLKAITQKNIIKLLKKLAAKVAAKGGAKLAQTGAVAGTVAASGCAGGPAGCAAGAAVGTAIFVWDCMNIVWDLMDTHGLTIVFNEEMIKGIGEGIKDSVNEAFAQYSDEPYLDTEIFFEPLSLVFVKDEDTDELVLSEEWGELYLKHVNHYMTKIKGHPDNWEELLPPAENVEDVAAFQETAAANTTQLSYTVQAANDRRRVFLKILLILGIFALFLVAAIALG